MLTAEGLLNCSSPAQITYYHKEENGVNYVFVGHGCYQRPGIYADDNGAYEDNQMRFTLLSLACCEAPLVRATGSKP